MHWINGCLQTSCDTFSSELTQQLLKFAYYSYYKRRKGSSGYQTCFECGGNSFFYWLNTNLALSVFDLHSVGQHRWICWRQQYIFFSSVQTGYGKDPGSFPHFPSEKSDRWRESDYLSALSNLLRKSGVIPTLAFICVMSYAGTDLD
jgi:hypothetical protein